MILTQAPYNGTRVVGVSPSHSRSGNGSEFDPTNAWTEASTNASVDSLLTLTGLSRPTNNQCLEGRRKEEKKKEEKRKKGKEWKGKKERKETNDMYIRMLVIFSTTSKGIAMNLLFVRKQTIKYIPHNTGFRQVDNPRQ